MNSNVKEDLPKLYAWLKEEFAQNLRFPSHDQIVEKLGLSSKSLVNARLRALEDQGLLASDLVFSRRYYRIVGAEVTYTEVTMS